MRIAICDDEKVYREETKNCIKEKWYNEKDYTKGGISWTPAL